MSQRNVEWVIGRLLTDEGFRERFAREPLAVLRELIDQGTALTPCECRALASFDAAVAARWARDIDPRLQKVDLTRFG